LSVTRTTGFQLAVATANAQLEEWQRVLSPREYRELVEIVGRRFDAERRQVALRRHDLRRAA